MIPIAPLIYLSPDHKATRYLCLHVAKGEFGLRKICRSFFSRPSRFAQRRLDV